MNQKITTQCFVAIDISKDSLQVQSASGDSFKVSNDEAGLDKLLKRLHCLHDPFVICEATGGYERPLLGMLHGAAIAVSLLNPARVRAFALSEGIKAKTDPIDARMILRFAQEKDLQPTPPPEPACLELAALLDRRSHLTEQMAREKNRLQKSSEITIGSIERMLQFLEKELEAIDAQMHKLLAGNALLGSQVQILQSVKGVGKVTAWSILAYLGEISHLGRNQIVALAGLAPFNRDSGKTSGKRSIYAGRAKVRKCLYMAAQTAARHNAVIKPYVESLIQRGKPYKCAIVAAMRKLLLHMQSLLKKHQKSLAQ